jgi:2-polyprenyl-6-methoxyphenol hydroxylase-like FAD-dependent oxidoreductase
VKEGVEMRFGCQVKEADQSVPTVTLHDGTKLEADLIVAADGISIFNGARTYS